MAEPMINPRYIKILLYVYLWLFQLAIGYAAFSLLFGTHRISFSVSATSEINSQQKLNTTKESYANRINENDSIATAKPVTSNKIAQSCADCRLVSKSIQELVSQPRQMDSFGQVTDRIDLDKIKKRVCRDYIEDSERERCRSFFYQQIGTVEKWKQSNTRTSFFDFVCIKELKMCCPRNSFGPKCTKCAKCQPNQHCHGDGTRQGDGTCVCKEGYTGARCMSCLTGYYAEERKGQSAQKQPIVTCKRCHKSCQFCRSEGPLGCEVCRKGFTWLSGHGCFDVDECVTQPKICGDNTFCVNTEGSYFCYECDRGCDGCHGDGPDMCLKCAKGYKLENGNCVALKKTILPPEANYYRYAIYTGLCICTCIILHNNVYLASLVGLGVAMYIGFCEYIMSQHTQEMAFKTGINDL